MYGSRNKNRISFGFRIPMAKSLLLIADFIPSKSLSSFAEGCVNPYFNSLNIIPMLIFHKTYDLNHTIDLIQQIFIEQI